MGYCHLLKQKRPEEVDIKSKNNKKNMGLDTKMRHI